MKWMQQIRRKKMSVPQLYTVQISGPDLMWCPFMHCQWCSLDDLKKKKKKKTVNN